MHFSLYGSGNTLIHIRDGTSHPRARGNWVSDLVCAAPRARPCVASRLPRRDSCSWPRFSWLDQVHHPYRTTRERSTSLSRPTSLAASDFQKHPLLVPISNVIPPPFVSQKLRQYRKLVHLILLFEILQTLSASQTEFK